MWIKKNIELITSSNILFVLVLTIGIFSLWSCANKGVGDQDLGIKHIVVIGFDGLSPDGLLNADTPTFDKLINEGASTLHARSVLPSSSSPNWASMIMGAGPEQHGITSNAWERDNLTLPAITQNEPFIFPTIFGLIDRQKPSAEIGAIYHWGGFGRLFEKGAVDFDVNPKSEDETAEAFRTYYSEKSPDFTFVHFDHVDHAGHEFGHGTPKYYASVKKADSLLSTVIKTIEKSSGLENTLVIISSDHGGLGKGHGGESLQEMEIPFILWGKGIKKGYKILYPVYQYDNAATVAFALGLKKPNAWIGRPVQEAFEGFQVKDEYPILEQLQQPKFVSEQMGYARDGGLFNDEGDVIIENKNAYGDIVYTLDGSMPNKEAKKYTEPIKLYDNAVIKAAIFVGDKMSSPINEAFYRIKKDATEEPITYEVYYLSGLSFIPELGSRNPDVIGKCFEFGSQEIHSLIKSNTAVKFKSTLNIDNSDSYTFSTRSDDGSKLYIDGNLVVDNDGDHGVREKNGSIELEDGNHLIEVLWFNGGGDGWLDVYIEGSGMPKQILPTTLLRP